MAADETLDRKGQEIVRSPYINAEIVSPHILTVEGKNVQIAGQKPHLYGEIAAPSRANSRTFSGSSVHADLKT